MIKRILGFVLLLLIIANLPSAQGNEVYFEQKYEDNGITYFKTYRENDRYIIVISKSSGSIAKSIYNKHTGLMKVYVSDGISSALSDEPIIERYIVQGEYEASVQKMNMHID